MTEREKYKAIYDLDESNEKMAALYMDVLNWVRVLRSAKTRTILQEMRGRILNSKCVATLSSPEDLQREILKKKYSDWDDEEVAFVLIKDFYKKKLKLQDKLKFAPEEEANIDEELQTILNIREHFQFDIEDWFRVSFSN